MNNEYVGYVYVVSGYRNGIIKIGKSSRIIGRLNQLQRVEDEKLTMDFVSEELSNAFAVENLAHCIMQRWSVGGEYYEATASMGVKAVEIAIEGWKAGKTAPRRKTYRVWPGRHTYVEKTTKAGQILDRPVKARDTPESADSALGGLNPHLAH